MNDEKLTNYLSGNASDQEVREVEEWLKADPAHSEYLKQFGQAWDMIGALEDYQSLDLDDDWNKIRERIGFAGNQGRKKNMKSGSDLYPFLRIAAVIVVILTCGVLAELKFHIISKGGGEMIAMSTEGESREITLSDGTNVFLNEFTEISYPAKFRRKREVHLTGEAFFEVVPDSKKPFLVYPGSDLAVEVVGTSFNVIARQDQDIVMVQVVSGEVSFYSMDDRENEIILTQDEQCKFEKSAFKKSLNINPNFLSWKTGILTFRDTPFPEVIQTLRTHFKTPIKVEGTGCDTLTLTSIFEHEKLMDILEEMVSVLEIEYSVENDTVIIKQGNS